MKCPEYFSLSWRRRGAKQPSYTTDPKPRPPLSSSITPHSFIPGLKPPFSANPSHRIAFLYFFTADSRDFPDCLPILLSLSVFTFSFFLLFSCWLRAVDLADLCISHRIVSHRTAGVAALAPGGPWNVVRRVYGRRALL